MQGPKKPVPPRVELLQVTKVMEFQFPNCEIGPGSNFRQALSEADDLIEQYDEASNPDVLTVKGDALYRLGSFEHALVNYYRALKNVSSKVFERMYIFKQ